MGSHRILGLLEEEDPRGASRRRVMMVAKIATSTTEYDVVIRNVSATGARLEGARLPIVGADVVLMRGAFRAFGELVWSESGAAGVEFSEPLEEEVLMEVLKGLPAQAAARPADWKRPGFNRGESHARWSDGRGWVEDAPSRRR